MANAVRAFVALELAPEAVTHAAGMQSALRARGLRLRWVRPQNMHLTLKFLGEIPQADCAAVGRAVALAGQGAAPLKLTLQGLGVFPGIRRPRVLWIGLGGQTEALGQLFARIEDELAGLGFDREIRGFQAHLTLARFKEPVAPQELLQAIEDLGGYAPLTFSTEKLVLFKSDLRPQGAVYAPLTEVRLGRLQANS
jgi:RNA 2',3'-cyclic 3'-phosphodiesterase